MIQMWPGKDASDWGLGTGALVHGQVIMPSHSDHASPSQRPESQAPQVIQS
jgi:hypothetical protein